MKDSGFAEAQPLNICAAALGPREQADAAVIAADTGVALYNLRTHEFFSSPHPMFYTHTDTPAAWLWASHLTSKRLGLLGWKNESSSSTISEGCAGD